MAGKILSFLKNPLAGIFGANSAKGKAAQQAQYAKPVYYGGSEGAGDEARSYYRSRQDEGNQSVQGGLAAGQRAYSDAQSQGQQIQRGLSRFGAGQEAQAAGGQAGFERNAGALEQLAQNAPQNFQKTDQAQFNAQQDQAQRQMLGLAAGGGAGGLRSALATGQDANMQAAQNAGITRAQEYNQLLGQQQQAYGQLAGAYQGQTQNANANVLNAANARGNLAQGIGQLGLTQSGQQTQAGVSQQGIYAPQETAVGSAQGQIGLKSTDQVTQGAQKKYTDTYRPIKSVLGF